MGRGSALASGDQLLLLWSVACPVSVSGGEERGSKLDQVLGDTAGSYSGTKVLIQAHFLCYLGRLLPSQSLETALLFSPRTLFTLVGEEELGQGNYWAGSKDQGCWSQSGDL